jgi:hypothetical protein
LVAAGGGLAREAVMDLGSFSTKTPATIEEIKARVAFAFERHPLCRDVAFDIVSSPRSRKGANWTICIQQVAPDALWEASDIVSDIQEAYILAAA